MAEVLEGDEGARGRDGRAVEDDVQVVGDARLPEHLDHLLQRRKFDQPLTHLGHDLLVGEEARARNVPFQERRLVVLDVQEQQAGIVETLREPVLCYEERMGLLCQAGGRQEHGHQCQRP